MRPVKNLLCRSALAISLVKQKVWLTAIHRSAPAIWLVTQNTWMTFIYFAYSNCQKRNKYCSTNLKCRHALAWEVSSSFVPQDIKSNCTIIKCKFWLIINKDGLLLLSGVPPAMVSEKIKYDYFRHANKKKSAKQGLIFQLFLQRKYEIKLID